MRTFTRLVTAGAIFLLCTACGSMTAAMMCGAVDTVRLPSLTADEAPWCGGIDADRTALKGCEDRYQQRQAALLP